MKLIITPSAEAQIDHQFAEGIARHGIKTAEKTFARVERFFAQTLVAYPRAGAFIAEPKLYEWYMGHVVSAHSAQVGVAVSDRKSVV